MQQERIKAIICHSLTIICMGVIFWLSSRTAEESSQQSGRIVMWLIEHFGDNFFTDFIVRKLAHFLEFTGLCFLFNLSLYQSKKKRMPFTAVALTSLYAITDEVHQLFVDGRSCQLTDWAIDTAGAVLGTIGFLILFMLISRFVKKKNTIDRTIN